MIKKAVTLHVNNDLDARPIAMLVQVASGYRSEVFIEIDEKKINAKSIMGMMSLQLAGGDEVTVIAEGADEETAIEAVEKYLVKEK